MSTRLTTAGSYFTLVNKHFYKDVLFDIYIYEPKPKIIKQNMIRFT